MSYRSIICLLCFISLCGSKAAFAYPDSSYVSHTFSTRAFPLSADGHTAPIFVDDADYVGVVRAAKDLQRDIAAVSKTEPALSSAKPVGKLVVIIGTIGKNKIIDQLISQHKLDVTGVTGKWETFLLQVVEQPLPGVEKALVITGSDKRGSIYGIYDLSAQIGVSPWYWWADVPVKESSLLYVLPGRHTQGTPAVKYRGIFINDEAPALSGWAKEKFGGLNHLMYEKMFELLLRLKANYLWPAMWGNAFNDDDPLNRKTADEYGIVMGTSHHEPMDRAQQEWKKYGKGDWNYATNGAVLRDFWKKGIENMDSAETIVTVGMRGDGDMPMSAGTNISLLENIVADQRKIIAEVTKKPAENTPQLWALYKEVQDYYDQGMRVPDDITLLLCDDNHGDLRKLPNPQDSLRKGGYGIYYHFDYVGGPRNYKWLNTCPISKTWEQMHLAYEHNVRQIWIVNVGDLKPLEFPISFFLDYAWNPDKIPASALDAYTQHWARQQFGDKFATQIADILTQYTRYNGRRKPELLDENTYSILHYREFETVVKDYNKLRDQATAIGKQLPEAYKAAYYELVQHPVEACANLNEMYYDAALNKLYIQQGRIAANDFADSVKARFDEDSKISKRYNQIAGGKWNHMMDQMHIGYVTWHEPPAAKMPWVSYISLTPQAGIGVAVEGAANFWENGMGRVKATLPVFDAMQYGAHYVYVYARGPEPVSYTIECPAWIKIEQKSGVLDKEKRIEVNIDWKLVPATAGIGTIWITSSKGVRIPVNVNYTGKKDVQKGFIQTDNYISIEAAHYQQAIGGAGITWSVIPDYGRTLSAVTVLPVTAKKQKPGGNSPHLEYVVNLTDTGKINIVAYLAPTIDFTTDKSLMYAISMDDEQPQSFHVNADSSTGYWYKTVSDNINKMTSEHQINKAGVHTIKFWMVSPGVVLEKLVLAFGEGAKESYLGPPESYFK